MRTYWIKKLSPAQLISLSFVLIIGIGTLLLMLPVSNEKSALWIDHLFVAVTSTCVTGLVPFAISDQYTLFGQIVILCLIQIGGLGFMSMMAFLMTLTKHSMSFREKGILMDAINRSSRDNLIHYLKSIFLYTMIFEMMGMLLLSIRFVPFFGWEQGLFQSLFLSVSAFCNAGIDLLGSESLIPYASDILVNLSVSGLIITGGLGFAVWFDLKNTFQQKRRKRWSFCGFVKRLSIHTKTVMMLTLFLLLFGTALFIFLEHSNPLTIGKLSLKDQFLISFFQSTTLRTAGFATIDLKYCMQATKFFMLGLMLIGGSPSGTAGGIKTTTWLILMLSTHTHLKNGHRTMWMKRSISDSSLKKAYIIFSLYLMILIISIFLLLIFENQEFLITSFEAVSALATVGLTCGMTSELSFVGKCIIIVLMFIGRVGPSTVLLSFIRTSKNDSSTIKVPSADLLIG